MKFASKKTIEMEIYEIGKMYRESKLEEARKCYDQYINLIILEESENKQSRLEHLWETQKVE